MERSSHATCALRWNGAGRSFPLSCSLQLNPFLGPPGLAQRHGERFSELLLTLRKEKGAVKLIPAVGSLSVDLSFQGQGLRGSREAAPPPGTVGATCAGSPGVKDVVAAPAVYMQALSPSTRAP